MASLVFRRLLTIHLKIFCRFYEFELLKKLILRKIGIRLKYMQNTNGTALVGDEHAQALNSKWN
jgi:hypothetical protein